MQSRIFFYNAQVSTKIDRLYITLYCPGGEKMNYKNLLMVIADEYGTTPDEVENEIKGAIKAAGLDITTQLFIAICTAKVIKDYKS